VPGVTWTLTTIADYVSGLPPAIGWLHAGAFVRITPTLITARRLRRR
jgi:hypothetical protein